MDPCGPGGYNPSGVLGIGTTESKTLPTQVLAGDKWTSVAARYAVGLAVNSSGALWAWGSGYLGDGASGIRAAPVAIQASETWNQIAGSFHILGIKSNGSLWDWGGGQGGALIGETPVVVPSVPVPVKPTERWQSVAVGSMNMVAIREDGTLWGWGSNSFGGLGAGAWREVVGGDVWGR